MWPLVVIALHGAALALAYLLLILAHEKSWYWHLFSIGMAIAIGWLMLRPWPSYESELAASLLFAFLLMWGITGPVLAEFHHQDRGRHA